MKKEMLINVLQPEECRIAIVEDGVLEELYVERASQESYVGNIYKGRIVNIEPSIQAAFVDFGIGRNGFLHVSDVDPAYYKHLLSKEDLAQYEEELDREYGGGGGTSGRRTAVEQALASRGPGRGGRDRGAPRDDLVAGPAAAEHPAACGRIHRRRGLRRRTGRRHHFARGREPEFAYVEPEEANRGSRRSDRDRGGNRV